MKKKKPRTSRFIHIGEIIPGVLTDIERRIKEAKSPPLKGEHKREKASNVKIHNACIPDLRIRNPEALEISKALLKNT